jgi:uncharacterized protein YeaO (DUF488 family)
MAVRIVQLGTPRKRGEGIRIGTVRRPPRGVPKSQFSVQNWYDVWLPNVAPSDALFRRYMKGGLTWGAFRRMYLAEMRKGEAARVLDVLAAMSRQVNFSIGCYCSDESRCHRSLLRQLLEEREAATR